jgi:hypothetical protein
VLLFSIQFNIVFPTFVCFVTVCWTVFYPLVFCILVTMLWSSGMVLSQSRSSRTSWTLLRKFTFFESSYLFMKILWCYLGFFPKLLMLSMGCGLNTFSKKTFQKSITIFDLKTNW